MPRWKTEKLLAEVINTQQNQNKTSNKDQTLPAILKQFTSLAFKYVQILYHFSLNKCLDPASQVRYISITDSR